jgi:hypothetical protein
MLPNSAINAYCVKFYCERMITVFKMQELQKIELPEKYETNFDVSSDCPTVLVLWIVAYITYNGHPPFELYSTSIHFVLCRHVEWQFQVMVSLISNRLLTNSLRFESRNCFYWRRFFPSPKIFMLVALPAPMSPSWIKNCKFHETWRNFTIPTSRTLIKYKLLYWEGWDYLISFLKSSNCI